jgi:hypothetical protein
MKFKGAAFKSIARGEVLLPRPGVDADPIVFKIKALPLGFEERAEKLFPNPKPPRKYARDNRKRIMKDNGVPVLEDDVHDEGFIQRMTAINRLRMMYFVEQGLDDDNWKFDCELPEGVEDDSDEMKEYYNAMWDEFKDSGFSSGDLVHIVNGIMEVSNLKDDAIVEARDSFA